MKKTIVALALFIYSLLNILQAQETTTQLSDWESLFGTHVGSLTYKDYSSEKLVILKCVGLTYEKKGALVLEHDFYEWGKIIRQKYTYKFKDGSISQEGNWNCTEKTMSADGKMVKAVFTQTGKDGNENRPCTFRKTFTKDGDTLTILKEVKFDDEEVFFMRNKYVVERL